MSMVRRTRLSSTKADLEVVEFIIDATERAYPKIEVKLRNKGGSVAFLKKAELIFDHLRISEDHVRYGTEIVPRVYTWLITNEDVDQKRSEHSLSRKIGPNDVDDLEFRVGFERLKSALQTSVILKLTYNEKQNVMT